jgi:hypothetical protein
MDKARPHGRRGAQPSDRVLRELAANIDERVRQILRAEPKISDTALVNQMIGFMPGLHRIWTEASDDAFLELLEPYPAFARYAQAIEDASIAYERDASPQLRGIKPLPESLRPVVARLLAEGGTLERRLQSLADAAEGHLAAGWHANPEVMKADAARAAAILALYQAWVAGLQRLVDELLAAEGSPAGTQLVHRAFTEMDGRLTRLTDRILKLALAGKAAMRPPGDEAAH